MIGHNVETIDAMTPEGFAKVNTELGDDVTITFDAPGIYVYKCTPHWGARMGGIIMVGQPEDPAAIIEQYRAAIEEDKSLLPAKGLLKKFEKDLEWVSNWVRFFIKSYYRVDSLDQVDEARENLKSQLRPLPEIEDYNWII